VKSVVQVFCGLLLRLAMVRSSHCRVEGSVVLVSCLINGPSFAVINFLYGLDCLDFLVGDKDRTYLISGMVIVDGVFFCPCS